MEVTIHNPPITIHSPMHSGSQDQGWIGLSEGDAKMIAASLPRIALELGELDPP